MDRITQELYEETEETKEEREYIEELNKDAPLPKELNKIAPNEDEQNTILRSFGLGRSLSKINAFRKAAVLQPR